VLSGMQIASCLRHIILWSAARLAVPYFSPYYLTSVTIFEGKEEKKKD
jgi:hypothetical protein